MKILGVICLLLVSFYAYSQPSLSWQKAYGGSGHEYAVKSIPVSGGGFVFVGQTESADGDIPNNAGGSDVWVAKANAAGTLEWSFTYGGSEDDEGCDIIQLADGSFFVSAWTDSNDGDVIGNHDTYSSDFWVLHINANGLLIKSHCFGGTSDDDAAAIEICPNGYILVAGTTYSNDGDVSGNHGSYETDVWVIQLDTALNLMAQKCIGGSDYEEGINMVATADNGCLIVGRSYSSDGDITGYHSGSDLLAAKLSSSLSVEWAKCFGGSETEEGNAVVQLADGSYAALGYTSTHNNGDVTGHHGASGMDDFWLVKLTSSGTLEWAKCYGGSGDDQADGLTLCSDGGFAMCGLTNSSDGDVIGYHSAMWSPDVWVAKVNASGTFIWQRCCGGNDQDESFNIYEESINVFVITAFTYSTDYDVTFNHGSADGWILRVTGIASMEDFAKQPLYVFPNPTIDLINFEAGLHGTLRIFDAQGKLELVTSDIETGTLQLPKLKTGLYHITIETSDYFFSSLLLIE